MRRAFLMVVKLERPRKSILSSPSSSMGIIEYWVLDVSGRGLIVHREPSPAGYRSVVAYNEFEKVAPLASPQHELQIGELFALE